MSVNTEGQSSSLDTVKLVLSVILLIAGMAGFYYFATWNGEPVSVLLRVVGLLVTTGAAIAIASTTRQGQKLISFLRDSRMEVRKMVWPTKQETLQTTLIVMVIVLVLAIFLWIVDTILGYGVKILFGGA